MMSGCLTKIVISLELSMGHKDSIYQLKALIVLYLLIGHKCPSDLNQREDKFKPYFSTFIF